MARGGGSPSSGGVLLIKRREERHLTREAGPMQESDVLSGRCVRGSVERSTHPRKAHQNSGPQWEKRGRISQGALTYCYLSPSDFFDRAKRDISRRAACPSEFGNQGEKGWYSWVALRERGQRKVLPGHLLYKFRGRKTRNGSFGVFISDKFSRRGKEKRTWVNALQSRAVSWDRA